MGKKKSTRGAGASIEAIRLAVRRRHGGFENASDQEILDLWRTFGPARQKRYLEGEIAGGRLEPEVKMIQDEATAAAEAAEDEQPELTPAVDDEGKDDQRHADTTEPE